MLQMTLITVVLSWTEKNSLYMKFKLQSQNSLDDKLRKSDVKVDICLKLLLIKLNPVALLLIPKD